MNALTYRERKPTGISFVPSVPADWKVARLRNAVDSLASGGTPDTSDERYWADSGAGVPWVSIGDMTREQVIFSTERDVTELGIATRRLEVFPVGTLLVSMYASLGKTSVLGVPATVNQAILAVRPNEFTAATFLRWWFDFLQPYLDQYSSANTQANLSAARIADLPMLLPPMRDQLSIVAFLDRETTKIDTLIAEQERLIALLQEKRQAVISHAVIKGLDPSVPMKDSGVEWIGAVPEHWTVSTIKRVGSIQYGLGEPPPYHEDGHPLVRATDVDRGNLALDTAVRVHEVDIPAGRIVWLEPGDIIVVRSGAGTGDSGQYWGPYRTAIAGFDMVLRPIRIDAAFLQWTLLASYVLKAQIDTLRMRAAQPHLNAQELGGCVLLIPPPEEQRQIAEFLRRSTQQLDAAAADASKAILLLRERRTALITAAVTGQIDVRGLVETAA